MMRGSVLKRVIGSGGPRFKSPSSHIFYFSAGSHRGTFLSDIRDCYNSIRPFDTINTIKYLTRESGGLVTGGSRWADL